MKQHKHPLFLQLRELRVQRKIKQCDLADKIGVTKPALSHWENGTRSPSWFNFYCWSQALGVQVKIEEIRDAVD